MNDYTNLQHYDVFKVVSEELKISDLLALEWIKNNIENGRMAEEKLDKVYYMFNVTVMCKELEGFGTCSKEAYPQRIKNLAKKGYIEYVSGHFLSKEFGYTRAVVRMGKNYKRLLREV